LTQLAGYGRAHPAELFQPQVPVLEIPLNRRVWTLLWKARLVTLPIRLKGYHWRDQVVVFAPVLRKLRATGTLARLLEHEVFFHRHGAAHGLRNAAGATHDEDAAQIVRLLRGHPFAGVVVAGRAARLAARLRTSRWRWWPVAGAVLLAAGGFGDGVAVLGAAALIPGAGGPVGNALAVGTWHGRDNRLALSELPGLEEYLRPLAEVAPNLPRSSGVWVLDTAAARAAGRLSTDLEAALDRVVRFWWRDARVRAAAAGAVVLTDTFVREAGEHLRTGRLGEEWWAALIESGTPAVLQQLLEARPARQHFWTEHERVARPESGINSETWIVVHEATGRKRFVKIVRAADDADNEEIAAVVARVLGARVPSVERVDALMTVHEYVDGRSAKGVWRTWTTEQIDTELSRPQHDPLALLDHLLGNRDRNLGNVMVDGQGDVWGVDHAFLFGRWFSLFGRPWERPSFGALPLERLGRDLVALAPEFFRVYGPVTGRERFEATLANLAGLRRMSDAYRESTAPGRASPRVDSPGRGMRGIGWGLVALLAVPVVQVDASPAAAASSAAGRSAIVEDASSWLLTAAGGVLVIAAAGALAALAVRVAARARSVRGPPTQAAQESRARTVLVALVAAVGLPSGWESRTSTRRQRALSGAGRGFRTAARRAISR
jgi:hypothetical protein